MTAADAAKLTTQTNLSIVNSQYQVLIEKISAAASTPSGAKDFIDIKGTLLPDVRAKLIADGFEVGNQWVGSREDGESLTRISWKNA